MNDLNPLTGLPGNRSIEKVLREKVIGGGMSAAYVDIVNFKPFNDHYGFALGDAVIRRLAMVLSEALPGGFVGHIGGDDFICAGEGDFASTVLNARQRFRSLAGGFYTRRDREQGGIETFDRSGSFRFFPMLDLAVVFVKEDEACGSVEELAALAGKRKKLMKGETTAEPVHPVLEQLIDSDEWSTEDKKAVIEACGVLREETAVEVLSRILSGNYPWSLRKSAALALGYIGGPDCAAILRSSLADSNPHVRTRSVHGLVLAEGSAAGPVIEPMWRDRSTWVRRAVYRGLGQSGWPGGTEVLEKAAAAVAPGPRINTVEERRAALEGMALMGNPDLADFALSLLRTPGYAPLETAYECLCSLGTDTAAEEILRRKAGFPQVVNLYSVSSENLVALEVLAGRSLSAGGRNASAALRFFEGCGVLRSGETVSLLRKSLGDLEGDLFERLIRVLDTMGVQADGSCVARVARKVRSGGVLSEEGLCAFLGWISARGGIGPGSLLEDFIRSSSRAISASAAVAAGVLGAGDLTRKEKR